MSALRWKQAKIIADTFFAVLAIFMFAFSCLTERPYLAAFWGVVLVCDEIRELGRGASLRNRVARR